MEGYTIRGKIADQDRLVVGHAIEITNTYIVLHDAVTREHIKFMFEDIDPDGLEQTRAYWLGETTMTTTPTLTKGKLIYYTTPQV